MSETFTPDTPAAYPFVPAGLRVEATWPDGCKPASMVVEINDRPVTAELVQLVVTTLANATEVTPDLIDAALIDPDQQRGVAR
jgi:hypothetical protein